MNPAQLPSRRRPGRFRVGDKVRLLYGWRGAEGEVIEDRGNLGVQGERVYTVHLHMDPDMTSEFPESSLEPVADKGENHP